MCLISSYLTHATSLNDVHEFSIPAGTLSQALQQYIQQSQQQILYFDAHLAGLVTQGVMGELTNRNALNQLLVNTHLVIQIDQSTGAIFIKKMRIVNKKVPVHTPKTPLEPPKNQHIKNDVKNITEVITVTGSRISGINPITSRLTITFHEFEKKGLKSVEDIMRYLPQNFSSTNSASFIDARGKRFNEGASTVNFRGLGESETLILINGQRISASVGDEAQYTDITNIPFTAIEKVEVITDGASAIYGSDAVTGVVNFILKEEYQGYEITTRVENSSNDADGFSIEQLGGFSWDTGNLTASFSYQKISAANSLKAGILNSVDFRDKGGRYFRQLASSQPGYLINRPRSLDPALADTSKALFIPGAISDNTIYGILPDGNGVNVTVNDLQYITQTDIDNLNSSVQLRSKRSTFSSTATPQREQQAFHFSLSQYITERLELNISTVYSNTKSDVHSAAQLLSVAVPTTNYYNNFEQDVFINNYSFLNEVASGQVKKPEFNIKTQRLNISSELTWELPFRDWIVDLSFNYSFDKNNSKRTLLAANNPDVMNALASNDPDTALNLFGDGSVQRNNLNSLLTTSSTGKRKGQETGVRIGLNGTLYTLSSGDIKFAIGAEERSELVDHTNYLFSPFRSALFPELDGFIPKVKNSSYFAELFIPVISEGMNIFGAKDFSFHVASRYDKYKHRGPFSTYINNPSTFTTKSFSNNSTKIGFSWKLNDEINLTYSRGEAYRVPYIVSLFEPIRQGSAISIYDAKNPGGAARVNPAMSFGGNPDLKSQTSVNKTFAIDYSPTWSNQFNVNIVWNNIRYNNLITTIDDIFGIDNPFILDNEALFPEVVERDENGFLVRYELFKLLNISSLQSESIDISAQYNIDTPIGVFSLGALATHTLALDFLPAKGAKKISRKNTDKGPSDWRINYSIDWTYRHWRTSVRYNYASGFEVTDISAINPSVRSYATVDLQVDYALPNSSWSFSGGIKNLLDPPPPFVDNAFGVDTTRTDFQGRVLYFNANKTFDF